MINNVNILGRITKEPQIQYTNSGVAYMQNSIANDRGYGDNKKTAFVPVVMWKQQAEYVSKKATKGSLVAVSGYIQTREYEKDGKKNYVVEVVAEEIQILDKFKEEDKETSENKSEKKKEYNPGDITDDDLPF